MTDETLTVGVEADANNAIRDMRAAADAAASLADSFREIASVAVNAAKALNKAEQGVTGTARSSKAATQATQQAVKALNEEARAANEVADAFRNANAARNSGNIYVGNNGTTRVSTPSASVSGAGYVTKQDIESLRATQFAREQVIQQHKRQQDAIRATVLANIAESKAWRESTQAVKVYDDSAKGVAQRMMTYSYATRDAAKATQDYRESLFTARFALHDISISTGIAGAALIALNAAAIDAAATYESAMASIQRTTGATSSQMAVIRDQFVELAQTIPGGFDNLAQIGELAGQLNIPTQLISSFTETVAKFSSSTDVAVEASAEAFGRLDTLLPDVQGNYEALGSSILNVGINSVATESAIISTTTQIAAAGAQARFTADEVIGLAASYASLGVAPEAARGSTIRIFSEIRQATLEGGAALDEFARLAGTSADAFKQAWLSGDVSDVFLQFLAGLQAEGANAETTLRNLGVTGVRDINALLRLSQNLDIVAQSFNYANSGFENATALTQAFDITSQTLNSRLEVLGQSFQALVATLGESGTGPLKEFVNVTIDLIKVMTDLANNPAAQWLTIFGGIFTLLAGGILLIVSFAARIGALNVALQTTRFELEKLQVAGALAETRLNRLQSGFIGAGIAATQFGNILKGVGAGLAIAAATAVIVQLATEIGEAFKSAGEKARDAFGDLSGLAEALRQDTAIYEETGERISYINGTLTVSEEKTTDWAKALKNATGVTTSLVGGVETVTDSVTAQTYAIGENTAAWLGNQLANNESVKKLFELNSQLAEAGAPQLNLNGIIASYVANDTAQAETLIADFVTKYKAYQVEIESQGALGGSAVLGANALLGESLGLIDDALQEAATSGQVQQAVNEALGLSAEGAADSLETEADAASTLASRMSDLRNEVENALSSFSVYADFGAAIEELFTGLANTGAESFNVLGADGVANLDNLESAIATTIAAGEQLGISATQSVAALFLELQKQGIDTANLIANLTSISSIGAGGALQIASYLSGSSQLTGQSLNFADALSRVAGNATAAARAVGGSGSRSLGGASRQAAKEVRTLTDYASDLQEIFSRAFDIRFGSIQSLDSVTDSWLKMRDAIDDANKAIADAQRTIASLTTDNNTLQYFLGVAQNYGDTLRAAEIADEIAQNNAKIADEQLKVSDATKTLDKNLNGNTASAIENRNAIIGIVQNYQELLESYASSGMSQQELIAQTAQLRAQFYAQATALGFSSSQLDIYAAAFDDVTYAINNVPRNLTVQVDPNPAITALNEIKAKAEEVGRSIGSSVGGGLGGAANSLSGDARNTANKLDLLMRYNSAVAQSIYNSRRAQEVTNPNSIAAFQSSERYWTNLANQLRSLGGFASGGYTGGGSPTDVRGFVHGKEYVINAQNTKRLGVPFLNALNSGMTPTTQGAGIQVVELSARDRALLAAAGNVQLSIDGKVVANATSSANFVSTKRGAN